MLVAIEHRLKHHLGADNTPAFPVVGSAMTVAAAFDGGLRRPVELYLVPLPSSYQRASQDLGPLSQRGMVAFGIAVGLKIHNDPKGISGNARIQNVLSELRRALVGWQPRCSADRIELLGEEPLGMKKDNFWYFCRFQVPVFIQQEGP